jgi:hypothetical protein
MIRPVPRAKQLKVSVPQNAAITRLRGVIGKEYSLSVAAQVYGKLSFPLCSNTSLQRFLGKRVETLPLHLRSHRQLLMQLRWNSQIELT